jgi:predicted RNA binding protein YcfA (HicA-like mRNA interferase family)
VSKFEKTLDAVLRGTSDHNIGFDELVGLLKRLGFELRTKGSHHIFWKDGVVEIVNLQPKQGGKAKPYQVKQVRNLIVKYKLGDVQDV